MSDETSALTAAAAITLGLLGSPHCVGMCGGIAGALGRPGAGGPGPVTTQLLLGLGRIAGYALLGALAGALGLALGDVLGGAAGRLLRVGFGVLIALAGLSVAGLFAGLGWLEALGARVWQRLSPLLGHLLPLDRPWKAVAAGALWGWLPCGLVYAALAGAIASAAAGRGALLMACFGLGTLPAVAATGALAGGLAERLRRRGARRLAGAMLLGFGVWTVLGALPMDHGAHPATGHEAGAEQPPHPHAHHGA